MSSAENYLSHSKTLERQHSALVQQMGLVNDALFKIKDRETASKFNLLLAKLRGILVIHLAQEDKFLYPMLIQSNDNVAAATAQKFSDEMGDLASVFDKYCLKWNSSHMILDNLSEMKSETHIVMDALSNRISREDKELYPLMKSV